MALTKEIEYQYEITALGDVQERERTVIYEDGEFLSASNHRRVVEVDADVSGESADIQVIFAHFATDEKKAARAAKKEKEKNNP